MGRLPFAVTGKVNKITLSIDRPKVTPEDETKPTEATRNNKVSERAGADYQGGNSYLCGNR
jgi:hypothetical protein